MKDLSNKYNTHSSSSLWSSAISYNSLLKLTAYDPKGDVYMTKSKKATLEEIIKIV